MDILRWEGPSGWGDMHRRRHVGKGRGTLGSGTQHDAIARPASMLHKRYRSVTSTSPLHILSLSALGGTKKAKRTSVRLALINDDASNKK